ncbi:MAG TPA: crotonase/enoyl-CoA hydratase family protein [Caulobacteraceae bacterium]|jgi:enoyl-CoA hydratase/carnithine racemase|nr:crotonase/enoyl-CoA hydratase family protein [Caulobacteraceae bacterium]
MDDRVQVNIEDGVADVRLVRADKMNALDDAMFSALVATGDRLKREAAVRCVVLSGEGRAFCAGLDMGNFGRMAEGPRRPAESRQGGLVAREHGIANRAQYAVWVWRELPMPVIAAVHGVAFGGGFQLALGADMRFVTPDARLAVLEIKWGLVPDMAGTQLMRHLAREDVVRELTYTGRIFSGEEALTYGFATRVCADPRTEALAVAREIAGRSPTAVRAAKRLLNAAPIIAPAAGLIQETEEQVALIGAPNQVEAVRANLEKREPRFAD